MADYQQSEQHTNHPHQSVAQADSVQPQPQLLTALDRSHYPAAADLEHQQDLAQRRAREALAVIQDLERQRLQP